MRYERPTSVEAVVDLIANASGGAFVMAGGSDLLVRMKGGFIEPDLIIDIKAVANFGDIQETAEGYRIGATVPCAVLGESNALRSAWPGVVEAANLIGSKQVQGRCTIVGNLCNASPAADSVPALIAANAKAAIVGPTGRRVIAVAEVPRGPGKNSLARGEIVEAILLDKRPPRSGDAYLRFIPRTEMDIAVVSAGISLTLDSKGTISAARVALGAVAPTALLVPEAAQTIVGTRLDGKALETLAEACSAACRPIDDKRGTIAFRKRVAGVLARRAAEIAYNRAGVGR
jgi:carbon-monoxide dehydrogenase medium subunit